jgi:hypothetical protein
MTAQHASQSLPLAARRLSPAEPTASMSAARAPSASASETRSSAARVPSWLALVGASRWT